MPAEDPASSARTHAPAMAGAGVASLLFMWPAVIHFFTRPMLGAGDGYYFYWTYWWVPHQVGRGRSPYSTDLLFHPVGADLRLSALIPLLGVVTSPIRLIFGPAAQINALQIGAAWLAAVAAYFLMLRVVNNRWVALIGGLAFSFSPWRVARAQGHLNLIHTAFLPLGILALLRFIDAPSRWRAIVLGVVVGAAFLTDPHLALLTMTCLIPVGIWARHDLRREALRLLLAGVVGLLVAAPVLVPMISAVLDQEGNPNAGPASTVAYSSDPLQWIIPPVTHPVLGDLAARIRSPLSIEGVAYPGIVILALALVACRLPSMRSRSPWIALAITGFVLSLGPYPSIDRFYVRVPLPLWFLGEVPFLNTMRAAGRFTIVGVLGLDILAMMALERLAGRRPVVLAGVALVLAFELLPGHFPVRADDLPAPYEMIAADHSRRAVLEIPLQWSTGKVVIGDRPTGRDDTVFLMYATMHGHPLVNGSVSRFSEARLDRLESIPVYRQLLALEGDPGFDDTATFDELALAELGIGFVVYHRDVPSPAVYRHLRRLDLPLLADDGTVIVWGVPPPPRRS